MPRDNRPKGSCLNHPDREEKTRGLCAPCYVSLAKAIKNGKITEAKALRRGMILKRRRTGRRRTIQPFPQTMARMKRCLNHSKT